MAKILLIEDINGVRSSLRTVLSLAGHSVVEAEDGRIGLERASEQQLDLVVTDIVMPNLDGSEVILSLKRNGAGTPVLAISGGGAWTDNRGRAGPGPRKRGRCPGQAVLPGGLADRRRFALWAKYRLTSPSLHAAKHG